MSWLHQLFARRLVEENAFLQGRVADLARKAADLKALADARGRNEKRMAQDIDARDERLIRQAAVINNLRGQLAARQPERASITRLREELEKQKRVNDQLSNQLLDATGHNGQPLSPAAREKLGLPTGVKS
jgi:hypothetical protein